MKFVTRCAGTNDSAVESQMVRKWIEPSVFVRIGQKNKTQNKTKQTSLSH